MPHTFKIGDRAKVAEFPTFCSDASPAFSSEEDDLDRAGRIVTITAPADFEGDVRALVNPNGHPDEARYVNVRHLTLVEDEPTEAPADAVHLTTEDLRRLQIVAALSALGVTGRSLVALFDAIAEEV